MFIRHREMLSTQKLPSLLCSWVLPWDFQLEQEGNTAWNDHPKNNAQALNKYIKKQNYNSSAKAWFIKYSRVNRDIIGAEICAFTPSQTALLSQSWEIPGPHWWEISQHFQEFLSLVFKNRQKPSEHRMLKKKSILKGKNRAGFLILKEKPELDFWF